MTRLGETLRSFDISGLYRNQPTQLVRIRSTGDPPSAECHRGKNSGTTRPAKEDLQKKKDAATRKRGGVRSKCFLKKQATQPCLASAAIRGNKEKKTGEKEKRAAENCVAGGPRRD